MSFLFSKIEKKWQKYWDRKNIYRQYQRKKKFYVLDMFPYPSGVGLHVGHPRGYIGTDVIARYKQMQGYSVLHPMGWDAFGLPAENHAIKYKVHPKISTAKNIAYYKKQLNQIGFTYDWQREINTTDPNYYKWTQWAFLKMFEKGLVYESYEPINWCPKCKTGLANEDLEGNKCERCSTEIERKPLRQWVIKITAYAERLLNDLKYLNWPKSIIEQQINWIGKSKGAVVKFSLFKGKKKIDEVEVFTTRLDTIFGVSFLALAPEHQAIEKLQPFIKNFNQVKKYINQAKKKTDLLRTDLSKEKTAVKLNGILAENPFNKVKVPVFVADYILLSYGTGAVMGVPAHDQRDYDLAKKYKLKIIPVVYPEKGGLPKDKAFEEKGILKNSGNFSGLKSEKAIEKMIDWLKKNKLGKESVCYKMRDWVFARQRYWGEPFPLVFCLKCKERIEKKQYKKGEFFKGELLNPGWIAVKEKDLPVKLPNVKSYQPTGTGESPLAKIDKWVKTKCPKCGSLAKRETNTMPQWAGSCWYYLRYLDPKNNNVLVDKKIEKKWMPVDLYVGGVEHATRHLLYARFWHKFLYDIGVVSTKEPFKKLKNQGLILGEDGRKMSKRLGNVVDPTKVIKAYGADAFRLFEMFIGPFEQEVLWNTNGLKGMKRFLDRIWQFFKNEIKKNNCSKTSLQLKSILHKTIKKVTDDVKNFRFNTAISQLMICFNSIEKKKEISKNDWLDFVKLISIFTPHLAEEIYHQLKPKKKSIFLESWPKHNQQFIKEEKIEFVIQVNGKVKDRIEIEKDLEDDEIKNLVFEREKIKKILSNSSPKKIIIIKNKLINLVI